MSVAFLLESVWNIIIALNFWLSKKMHGILSATIRGKRVFMYRLYGDVLLIGL